MDLADEVDIESRHTEQLFIDAGQQNRALSSAQRTASPSHIQNVVSGLILVIGLLTSCFVIFDQRGAKILLGLLRDWSHCRSAGSGHKVLEPLIFKILDLLQESQVVF